MGSQMIELMSGNAEIFKGELECQKRSIQLLDEFGIPRGLLPLTDITEIGLVRSEGFICLKQKKRKDHYFEQIGRSVSFSGDHRLHRATENEKGYRSEGKGTILLWVTVTEMSVNHSTSGNVLFKTNTGISRSFPASAFV